MHNSGCDVCTLGVPWGGGTMSKRDFAEGSASGWGSGGPRFQSHPRLTFQSCSRYQLNQLGSKAASESTSKSWILAGYQMIDFTFYFFLQSPVGIRLWLGVESLVWKSVKIWRAVWLKHTIPSPDVVPTTGSSKIDSHDRYFSRGVLTPASVV